jgi:hypothetical protein
MSLREELEKAMRAQEHYEATGVMPTWAKMAMVNFLRDHGHALLESVADAERYRHVRDSQGMTGFWICHGIFGEGASRWTGKHADRQLDAARSKTVDGGGA